MPLALIRRRHDGLIQKFGVIIVNFGIGLLLLSLAALLVYLGRPDKDLNSPRFLQFNAALVLYPPVILVVLAFGATELIYALLEPAL